MSAGPKWSIVKTVTHRERGPDGQRVGHIGVIQKRMPRKVKKYGGKAWAAWAWRLWDGNVRGGPERFETYDTEGEATAHAAYAAGRA